MALTGTGKEESELQKGQVLILRAILTRTISAVWLPSQGTMLTEEASTFSCESFRERLAQGQQTTGPGRGIPGF